MYMCVCVCVYIYIYIYEYDSTILYRNPGPQLEHTATEIPVVRSCEFDDTC